MPLLGEISSVQPSLHVHLGTVRAQSIIYGKASQSSSIFRNGKILVSSWKSSNLPSKLHGDVESFKIRRGRIFITTVATFKTQSSVQKQDGNKGSKNPQLSSMRIESADKDLEEMDEKERLRRMRISQANKGSTPWNKGRKHSAETRQRISEKTRIGMQNFEVKMKLVGHAQSDETKEKIAAAMKRRWERRREALMLQESCHFEWQNLIAEASRTGFAGEDELQWDSYEQRKATKSKGCTREPKTPEQRRKIAAAITAKWTDPEYCERISSAKSKKKKSKTNTQSTKEKGSKKKSSVSQKQD